MIKNANRYLFLAVQAFTVLGGSHVEELFEKAGKIVGILKTTPESDIADQIFGGYEKTFASL